MTILIFPSEPYELSSVDPDFQAEREAAMAAGFETLLLDTDEMSVAAKGLQGDVFYRGWMLKPVAYRETHQLLARRGLNLVTSPQDYRACHYLPDWYDSLQEVTPRSLWFEGVNFDEKDIAETFGERPLILKDYVKSAKHYWNEACFIPCASDFTAVERVVERFLEIRDGSPEGGLVFREFLEFKRIGQHQKSGMPLTLEYRLFFLNGELLCCSRYWGDSDYPEQQLPSDFLEKLAQRVASPFFSMDVACDIEGRWWIVEIGDGQVSGLPDDLKVEDFYGALASALKAQ